MKQTRIITSIIPPLPLAQSLDSYLAGRFTYLTQAEWQAEIHAGKLSLNGLAILDPAAMLQGGETITWDGSRIVEPLVDENISILYEDQWFVAVDKTGNLPVHPSGRYLNNTLVALLTNRYGRKVYPVHRLDRETSGVVLLAFDGKSARELSAALKQATKEYLALVHGKFPAGEMVVDLPLGQDTESAVSKKRKAWPGGTQSAVTRFKKVLTAGDISLVHCYPQTGRQNQIRAHLLAAGFPIVGDNLYGRDENSFLIFIKQGLTAELASRLLLPRSALHSSRLGFLHPQNKKEMSISAPLPSMFSDFIRSRKNCC